MHFHPLCVTDGSRGQRRPSPLEPHRQRFCELSTSQARGVPFGVSRCAAAISKMFWHWELNQYENDIDREMGVGFLESHSSVGRGGGECSLSTWQ